MANLKNYSLRRLIFLDKGINNLFNYLTHGQPSFSDDQWESFYEVLAFQGNVQDEIKSRIPE